MSALEFLEADPSSPEWRSPLAAALAIAPAGISDVTAEVGAVDLSSLCPPAGATGLELAGDRAERALRALTDLDLGALPAVGACAHVRTLVLRVATDRFRLWFPQEYGEHVAGAATEAWEAIA